ncbi:hypothetical protein [Halomonas sp. PR-M31]|uniref:hypothetical protein n=1 Tax=Halomonas sp. PR-M31 TaxID=1471202 RepID=UPI0006524938|nr:hypothetical protein [Halomonas sp. PR-M31]
MTDTNKLKRPGRPRKFSVSDGVSKAMALFHARGISASARTGSSRENLLDAADRMANLVND